MDNTKKEKYLNIFLSILIIVILVVPKINIISIQGSRNGIRIDDIFILIYAIILLYRIINKKIEINKQIKNIMLIFGIYIFICIISTIINSINGRVGFILSSLYVIRKIEYFVLFFAGIDFYNTSRDKNSIFKLLNSIVIFHIVYSILEYTNIIGDIGHLIGRPDNDRIYSTFSGPYEFSAFFSIMACIYIVKILKDKDYFSIPLLIISIGEILISQSRISILSVLVLTIATILYYFKSKKQRIITIMCMCSLILIFILLVNFSNITILKRFKTINLMESLKTFEIAWNNTDYDYYASTGQINYSQEALNSSNDLSYVFRISKWATLLKETIKSPIIGLGSSIVGEGIDGNIVRIICENGLLGIVIWLLLIIYIFKVSIGKNKNRYSKFVAFITINMFIIAIFIDIYEASKIMSLYWFLIGTAMVVDKRQNEKIKIVHVLSGLNFGGVEAVLYNYFSRMDKNLIDNVIISHDTINKENAKMFEDIGFKTYKVIPKRESIIKNFVGLYKIVKNENPDVLHVHMTSSSYLALFVGYLYGVDIRICHSHLSFNKVNIKDKFYNILCRMSANLYMACSRDAGNYLFGKNNTQKGKVNIVNNAIDLKRFDYDEETRIKLRKKMGIENKFVIGNIGRFSEQKNQIRILQIFKTLYEKNNNSVLILIGNGEEKQYIIDKSREYGIFENIIYMDAVKNVEDYYQVMDVFLFPSLYEGLGIVIIEAQTSGLPCIVSDVVPKEVEVTDLIKFIKLEENDEYWCNEIVNISKQKRKSKLNIIEKSNYNIYTQTERLKEIYFNLLRE